MPETMTTYEHVQIDVNGVPTITGTNMKVVELVMAQLAHGWSAEELHFQHPLLVSGPDPLCPGLLLGPQSRTRRRH